METHRSLDLSTGDSVLLVVVSQSGSLTSNSFENVIDKRVHDAHRLRRDTGFGMDLLQDFIDVNGIAFLARLPSLLLFGSGFAFNGCRLFLAFLGYSLARHLPSKEK